MMKYMKKGVWKTEKGKNRYLNSHFRMNCNFFLKIESLSKI